MLSTLVTSTELHHVGTIGTSYCDRDASIARQSIAGVVRDSSHAVADFGLAEKIFSSLFTDEARVFEFEISALDFAFVDGEFLGERGGRGEGFAGGEGLVANLVLDLFANLRVDGIVRQVFQFNVHGRFSKCSGHF